MIKVYKGKKLYKYISDKKCCKKSQYCIFQGEVSRELVKHFILILWGPMLPACYRILIRIPNPYHMTQLNPDPILWYYNLLYCSIFQKRTVITKKVFFFIKKTWACVLCSNTLLPRICFRSMISLKRNSLSTQAEPEFAFLTSDMTVSGAN